MDGHALGNIGEPRRRIEGRGGFATSHADDAEGPVRFLTLDQVAGELTVSRSRV